MTREADLARALAPRLSAAMLERVRAGTADGGWLHDAVRRELREAHAEGLEGVAAVTAAVAMLLAAQAREVHTTLMHHAARRDAEAASCAAALAGTAS